MADLSLTWHSHLSFCSFWKARVLVSTVLVYWKQCWVTCSSWSVNLGDGVGVTGEERMTNFSPHFSLPPGSALRDPAANHHSPLLGLLAALAAWGSLGQLSPQTRRSLRGGL